MALIHPSTGCQLCQNTLNPQDELGFAASAFLPPDHNLYRFADAAMHWRCYYHWDRRAEFAEAISQALLEQDDMDPVWHRVARENQICVRYGEVVEAYELLLETFGWREQIAASAYDEWVRQVSASGGDCLPLLGKGEPEVEALRSEWARAAEVLSTTAPTHGSCLARLRSDRARIAAKKERFDRDHPDLARVLDNRCPAWRKPL